MIHVILSIFLFLFFCCPIICANLRGTALVLLILASLPLVTPKTYSMSQPQPQRCKWGDVKSLVGCQSKETLYCCWVTLVVFSTGTACSDSTYNAGHHLLCLLLMTMPANSRSQIVWVFPPDSRLPLLGLVLDWETNLHQFHQFDRY